ncbi:MAG: DUF1932 domain-containing protein [Candidatus Rokuibacteriota bacterium]
MTSLRVGFIGFGEVASVLAGPLCAHGASVSAYDVLLDRGGVQALEKRAGALDVRFRPLAELTADADHLLSTVTTDAAVGAARACAGHLRPGQVYLDLNSTAPSVKIEIERIVRPSGAAFVEGAILGAVGATGARTRILTGGPHGREVAETLAASGLRVAYYSPVVGQASTFKMLRSIFSKGLEALILELRLAGRRAGIERDLWDDVLELMTESPFERVAGNWVRTHAVASARRHAEMAQVMETMRELGIEPVMTAATLAFFARSRALPWADTFAEKPDSVDAVVTFLAERAGTPAGATESP